MNMPTTTAPAPVLNKSTAPTQEELLDQVRAFLPQAMHEWLKSSRIDVPLMRSAPFLDLAIRAQKLGMAPLVRFEIDEAAPLKFAATVQSMEPDARSRSAMLKAAFEATRCSIALRDTHLLPPLGKAGRAFEAHELDSMRDRNFASLSDAFAWLDRAETTGALAKREQLAACENKSFLVCPA